jgi:hypothetical protein
MLMMMKLLWQDESIIRLLLLLVEGTGVAVRTDFVAAPEPGPG